MTTVVIYFVVLTLLSYVCITGLYKITQRRFDNELGAAELHTKQQRAEILSQDAGAQHLRIVALRQELAEANVSRQDLLNYIEKVEQVLTMKKTLV